MGYCICLYRYICSLLTMNLQWRGKNKAKITASIVALLCLFMTAEINAKSKYDSGFFIPLTASDTIPEKNVNSNKLPGDTLIKKDSVPRIDTLYFSPDSLNASVVYEAEDSAILYIPSKTFLLYGKAKVNYENVQLEAGVIRYDQQKEVIAAFGPSDTAASAGPLNLPTLTQDGAVSKSDTIYFNVKTQKGLTKNTYYQEGELFLHSNKLKKVSADVAFAYKNRFTTCNLDTPHFAFRTARMKVINEKFAVAGLSYPEFEGVPMPVGIPFGIFPLSRGRHSGLLPPQFAANEDYGLGLEGLGYYKVINDNWDVILKSDIYSYGGYRIEARPTYIKRYRYQGTFNLSFQKIKMLNKDYNAKLSNEFFESNSFFIDWTHYRDNRAHPGTSFSASVHAGSSQHYRYMPNNAYANYTNQLYSSIAWSKSYNDGKQQLSVNANHNQNNLLHLQNINPSVSYMVNTFYPLQRKMRVGAEKWYEKIAVSYNGNLESRIPFYDTAFNFSRLIDTIQWGAVHNPSISLPLPPVGPVIFSPGITYSERWYGQKSLLSWNAANKKIDTSLEKGFFTAREISFAMNASTRVFGTYNFNKSRSVEALRHEIKPYVSFNYKPDLMSHHYYDVQVDTTGKNFRRLPEYQSFATFGEGVFGGMYFGIDNLLEMKLRNKEDSTEGSRKMRLIDGLSISSGYNFLADSLQLQPIDIRLRSTLFEKINISAGAVLDPYQVDTFGRKINRFNWSNRKFNLGRLTTASLTVSTSLQSKKASGKEAEGQTTFDPTLTPDEQMRQLEYIRNNPAEFVDFDIPWSLQLSFSAILNRVLTPDLKDFTTQITSGLNLNGDFSLTPKWKIGGGSYVDLRTMKIESLSMFISREMHCWQMSINLTPVGYFRSFSITISPKSGILRDLRINRNRSFYSGL